MNTTHNDTRNTIIAAIEDDIYNRAASRVDKALFAGVDGEEDSGFELLRQFARQQADFRTEWRLQEGIDTDIPTELQARENAEILQEALVGMAEEIGTLDEAVTVALWLMFRDGHFQVLEYDSLSEWAHDNLDHVYSRTSLAHKCASVENVVARVYAREQSGNPVIIEGDGDEDDIILTADALIRMKGLAFKMQNLATVFSNPDLSEEDEDAAFDLLLNAKGKDGRDQIKDFKDEVAGKAVVKVKWHEVPAKDETGKPMERDGEPLFIPVFPPMTAKEIMRLEESIKGLGEKVVAAN